MDWLFNLFIFVIIGRWVSLLCAHKKYEKLCMVVMEILCLYLLLVTVSKGTYKVDIDWQGIPMKYSQTHMNNDITEDIMNTFSPFLYAYTEEEIKSKINNSIIANNYAVREVRCNKETITFYMEKMENDVLECENAATSATIQPVSINVGGHSTAQKKTESIVQEAQRRMGKPVDEWEQLEGQICQVLGIQKEGVKVVIL